MADVSSLAGATPSSRRTVRVREYDEDPLKQDSFDDLQHHHLHHHFREYQVTIEPQLQRQVQQHRQLATSSVNITRIDSNLNHQRLIRAPIRVLKELFLPVGFPSSVNDGYLEYQLYDSLQGLCSYLRGVLCSAQVLQAAGVGKSTATALSAAMTWALKDGVSMVGGLVFSYTTAPLFDAYVKEFRLFADLINDVGLTLDMMAPYFENNLLLVASAAGLCKSLCGLSAGATKSSITQHFALEGNMADLNAKEATQETLVSLLGMMLGVTLAHQLSQLEHASAGDPDHPNLQLRIQLQWLIFSFLTLVHVWANWKGVRLLRMRTLNRERATVVLKEVVEALVSAVQEHDKGPQDDSAASLQQMVHEAIRNIPPPIYVHESLLSSTLTMLSPGNLRLSADISQMLQDSSLGLDLLDSSAYDSSIGRFVLTLNHLQRKQPVILVTLLVGATTSDQLQALLNGLVIKKCLAAAPSAARHSNSLAHYTDLVNRTRDTVKLLFSTESNTSVGAGKDERLPANALVTELAHKGWEIERVYLGFSRARVQITPGKED